MPNERGPKGPEDCDDHDCFEPSSRIKPPCGDEVKILTGVPFNIDDNSCIDTDGTIDGLIDCTDNDGLCAEEPPAYGAVFLPDIKPILADMDRSSKSIPLINRTTIIRILLNKTIEKVELLIDNKCKRVIGGKCSADSQPVCETGVCDDAPSCRPLVEGTEEYVLAITEEPYSDVDFNFDDDDNNECETP